MTFQIVGVKLVADDGGFFGTMNKADSAVDNFGKQSQQTFGQMPGLADIAVGAFHAIGTVAVDAFFKAGQAAVGFFTDSISAAGDFEAGMNSFAAVAGGALDEAGLKTEDFKKLFLDLGKELPVSTAEVQKAATEMIKGGIDPATVAAGGLRQTIQFAAAAMEGDLAGAAEVSAKILGGWAEQGATAAEKAALLTSATDLLTKAANASTVDVKELALGLYNVQGTAKTTGLSLTETTTALAELAPRFASANEAGTSFRNFLVRLQPHTQPAIDAMQSLGLYTEKTGSAFFDAQGKFVGVAKASQLLQDATKGLTDAQKVQALQTIFGNDAMNSAAAFAEMGATGFNDMTAAMEKQNGVQATAQTVQQGYNVALDNFHGSIEALQITLGEKLLPVLTSLFNDYLAPGINILTDLATAGSVSDETFSKLTPTMQAIVTVIDAVTEGFNENGLMGALQQLSPGLADFVSIVNDNMKPILAGLAAMLLVVVVPAFVAWAAAAGTAALATIAALAPVIAPIVLIGATVGLLVKAWDEDWGGIKTTLTDFWNNTGKPIFDALVNWLGTKITAAITSLSNFWNNTLMPAITTVWNFISTKIMPLLSALANVGLAVVEVAVKSLAKYWDTVLSPALKTAYDWFNDHIKPILDTVSGKMESMGTSIKDKLTPAFTWLNDNVLKPAANWFGQISDKIEKLIKWLNDLAARIRSLPSLPSSMVGNSPPPMANWFNSIAGGAANAANAIGSMSGSVRAVASPAALMAGASSSSATYNQQRSVNLTYNTQYAPSPSLSLAMAQALG